VPRLTLLFLLAYLAAVLGIGLFWRRRASRDQTSFFIADRSLSTFWGFIGLASLTTGGSTTIALAALVYSNGLSGLWLDLAGALGLIALGLLLAGRVRREGTFTLPEIVGRYYGPAARFAAALLVLVSEIVWFALLITATQVVLTAAFAVDPLPAIFGSTAVFVAYTALGGHFAVVRTDLLQYGLTVIGLPVIGLSCALLSTGGLGGLPREVWSFPTSESVRIGDIFGLLVLVGLPHLVGSDVYLKILSCRDERTARRSALWAALSKVVIGLSVAGIALAARKALTPMAPGETLPAAIAAFAPEPLAALVLVSLVATMQTSADVVLLSATAVTVRDLAPPLLGRPAGLGAARLLTPAYGALGLSIALLMGRDVLETLKLGYSIFAAGLILPVLFAFLPGRLAPPAGGAILAMAAGGATAAAGRLAPGLFGRQDPVLIGTGVNLLVLLLSLAVPRLTRRRAA
jgi:SSS family solute:Na+ symporter